MPDDKVPAGNGRRVLVLGATGLVGHFAVEQLAALPAIARTVVLARRPSATPVHANVDWRVVDFDRLGEVRDAFAVDAILCALGTTIAQVGGSQERFRAVDHDIPLAAAKLGRAAGVRHFLLVSALGASATSRVFYNRVKGELENDLRALGFPSLTIAQPSLLVGPRAERRRGEEIGKRLGWLVPAKWKPIEARDVAAALVSSVLAPPDGERVLSSRDMRGAAARLPA